jgi:predicted transcriptional regulator
MALQGPERDVMATFINSMMFIVLGDDTIFNKARAGAKNYAVEETDLEENAKIVAHLKKRYGDNIRKSHVMSAAKDFGVDASKLSKAVRKHLGKTMLEGKEKQEYDYEGDMAMSQLKSIIANSQRMHDMLSDDTNLPEWVQSKITLAEDYITTASNYMQGEMSEAVGDYTVKTVSPADAWKKHTGQMTKKTKVPVDPKTGKTLYQKVTSEEVEQLDELSPEKLAWYKKHSEKQADKSMKSMSKHLDKAAVARGRGNSPKGKMHDAIASAHYKKSLKRTAGMSMARKKLANEEVGQIDELSKATMGSYVNKAAERIGTQGVTAGLKIAADEKSSKNFKSMGKRQKGIATAVKKLTKEDIDAVKKINESYKIRFDAALEHYNIKSPSELDEDKRKEFFQFVDQEFKKGDQ